MPTPAEPKAREMVLLDVHEVSLVDKPAIRRVFLAKRDKDDVPTDPSEIEILALYKRDGFEVYKLDAPQPTEITTALGIVIPMLRRMASQLPGEDKTALMRVAGLMAQLQGGSMALPDPDKNPAAPAPGAPPRPPVAPPKPPMPPAAAMSDEEKQKKMEEKEKALAEKEKALEEKEKALGKLESLKPEKKQKSEGDENEPWAMLTASGIVPVAKGRKMVTEEREKALSDGIISMVKAFAAVAGEEKVKMMFSDLLESFKDLPKNVTIDQQVTPKGEGKPVLKSEIADAVAAALAPVQAELAKVQKQLDARPAGSVPPNESGNKAEVKKSASMFAGVV